MQKRR